MSEVYIIKGDARAIPLADSTVQCVVTSPPYWGLRKYAGAQDLIWGGADGCEHEWVDENRIGATGGKTEKQVTNRGANGDGFAIHSGDCVRCGAWCGAFGLEPTIEMYVVHTVEILREIRRVLRPDGVVFWNIGDSYNSGTQFNKHENTGGYSEGRLPGHRAIVKALKPKDLCLIPERVAIAAQDDGWWVRSMIIWNKPNTMPESCTDRPTDAYEHIIMLTKSSKYFWDADAVKEVATCERERGTATYQQVPGGGDNGGLASRRKPRGGPFSKAYAEQQPAHGAMRLERPEDNGTRNLRNVWTFPTQPYRGAHFATFPEEIPRRCIMAATSERGACCSCGTPWKRVTEKPPIPAPESEYAGKWFESEDHSSAHRMNRNLKASRDAGFGGSFAPTKTIGWQRSCECLEASPPIAPQPCVVLDPFGGSGTTARVAVQLNRNAVSLDLAYHDHAEKRTRNVQRRLVESV